nr:peroxiredoxin-2B [Tanacetum cinerariifolium]
QHLTLFDVIEESILQGGHHGILKHASYTKLHRKIRRAQIKGERSFSLGLELDLSKKGLGVRSRRYAMLVDNLKVDTTNIEEGGEFTVPGAADILKDCMFHIADLPEDEPVLPEPAPITLNHAPLHLKGYLSDVEEEEDVEEKPKPELESEPEFAPFTQVTPDNMNKF